MIITINGTFGSGKSTVAKFLAKKLGYTHHSVGDFMGEIALKRGVSLLELSKMAEKDPSIDDLLDEKQIYIGEHHDDFIIDARLGWHFIPHSFKIFLKCDFDVGAKRIFGDKREDEKKENISLEETKKAMKRRLKAEKKRYKDNYDVDDHFDENHYDFVLDTSKLSKEEVKEKVLKKVLEEKQKREGKE
jgi:cytidylate kinase